MTLFISEVLYMIETKTCSDVITNKVQQIFYMREEQNKHLSRKY